MLLDQAGFLCSTQQSSVHSINTFSPLSILYSSYARMRASSSVHKDADSKSPYNSDSLRQNNRASPHGRKLGSWGCLLCVALLMSRKKRLQMFLRAYSAKGWQRHGAPSIRRLANSPCRKAVLWEFLEARQRLAKRGWTEKIEHVTWRGEG